MPTENTTEDKQAFLRLPEAARYLEISDDRLRAMVRQKAIPFYRFSPRDTRFRREDLDGWLAACRNA